MEQEEEEEEEVGFQQLIVIHNLEDLLIKVHMVAAARQLLPHKHPPLFDHNSSNSKVFNNHNHNRHNK